MYVSTHNTSGGQIWRMDVANPGPGNWEQVLDASGFNDGFRNLAVFNGKVYAGSRNQGGDSELWRSDENGENFVKVHEFTDMESVRGLQVFEGNLYVGLQESISFFPPSLQGEIWRVEENEDGTIKTIAKLNLPPDLGDPGSGNQSMHTMTVHDGFGRLYVATRNNGGFQLWSWDGDTYNGDVAAFECIVGPGGPIASGFGLSMETVPLDNHIHNGNYLFVGMLTGTVISPPGFSIFRINLNNYTDSARVASGGLGDSDNVYAWRIWSFGNVGDGTKFLWAGTFNSGSGKGAEIHVSDDNGENWNRVIGALPNECSIGYGFNDLQNYGIRSFTVIGRTLYIGTAACLGGSCAGYTGCEVWALEDWTFLQGDVDNSGTVDLTDVILALQVAAGLSPAKPVFTETDVNGDGKIGIPEAIFGLQKIAGLR